MLSPGDNGTLINHWTDKFALSTQLATIMLDDNMSHLFLQTIRLLKWYIVTDITFNWKKMLSFQMEWCPLDFVFFFFARQCTVFCIGKKYNTDTTSQYDNLVAHKKGYDPDSQMVELSSVRHRWSLVADQYRSDENPTALLWWTMSLFHATVACVNLLVSVWYYISNV